VTAWCVLALAIAVAHALATWLEPLTPAIPIQQCHYLDGNGGSANALPSLLRASGRLSQVVLACSLHGVADLAGASYRVNWHSPDAGAFLREAMPKMKGLVREIAQKTEIFILIFLLPMLRSVDCGRKLKALNSLNLWLLCAAVVGVAIIGKYFGTI